nr:reverse transcriptase family protein [uncultured Intestinibacter sp.]
MKIWKIDDSNKFFNEILDLNEDSLKSAIDSKEEYYRELKKIKKKNGYREIYIINKEHDLYKLQKNICINFLNNIMISDASYGFRKKSNYIEYLYSHTDFYKEKYYLRLDIKDFFGSIDYEILKECLEYYFEENENLDGKRKEELLEYTIDILTYNNKIIQGAPSSPVISNILFRQLDIRIIRYCRQLGITYTRYADDLLFSSHNNLLHKKSFIIGIKKILASKNFDLNYDKIIRGHKQISLNGYVISDSIRLSRKKLSDLNRVLFCIDKNNIQKEVNNENKINISGDYLSQLNVDLIKYKRNSKRIEYKRKEKIVSKEDLINYLTGNRAFLISVLKYCDDEKYIKKMKRMINKIENIILDIDC